MRTLTQSTQIGKAAKFNPLPRGLLQRQFACGNHTVANRECSERAHQKKNLQRNASNQREAVDIPPIVYEVLSSPGQPLDAGTRNFMEPRFGHDFSQVRVHDDAVASESAAQVRAHAYTVGQHIIFGRGRYNSTSSDGAVLLAHELTHTLQQSRGGTLSAHRQAGALQISDPGDLYEREAATMAKRVMSLEKPIGRNHGQSLSTKILRAPTLLRDPVPDYVPATKEPEKQEDVKKPLIPIPIFDEADPTVITPDVPGLPGLIKGQPVALSTLKKALDLARGKKPDSEQRNGDCATFGMEKAQFGPFKGMCCKQYKRDANNCCPFNDIAFRSGRCCTQEEVLLPRGECFKPKPAPIPLPKLPPPDPSELQDAPERSLPVGTEYA